MRFAVALLVVVLAGSVLAMVVHDLMYLTAFVDLYTTLLAFMAAAS